MPQRVASYKASKGRPRSGSLKKITPRAVVRTEGEHDMRRFRWDLYYPWYFLADLAIMAAILAAVWWFTMKT